MEFLGEHLWLGQVGHLLVLTAFAASILSTVSFYLASKNRADSNSWLQFGKKIFIIQSAALFLVFAALIFVCSQHWFEYMYAYKHSSKELEFKYLLACIWEGQEGSFLLWSLWHSVIGCFILLKPTSKENKFWTAPVMSVIGLAQFFLVFMLVGIYIGEAKLGSSPFTLTRNEIAAPIFQRANYLSLIKDGVGLNILLRNYWMVIHPPILFLGFALTIVPFAYAYAGIQQKKFGEWVAPALPWALGCAAILGTGIMMGGKWAYESLSFGGFWAWDPVENASLVPWLILIAGMHTMVIYKATKQSLKASYFFIFLSFGFILYSTFLTRTGVLGDTSVHAFTEAGKAINIMIGLFVAAFVIPALIMLFANGKKMSGPIKEEETNSREFWMFIGSLTFFLTAMFIIAKTSVPVYNKITGSKIAPPEDVEFSYNKIMALVAIILGMLTAVTQYYKYKATPKFEVLKKLALPFVISAVLMLGLIFLYPLEYRKQGIGFLIALYVATFACIFTITANVKYFITANKMVFLKAGSSISHIGFGVMILGMLITSSNKETISNSNTNGIVLPVGVDPQTRQQDNPKENLTLIRDVPATMGAYAVTFINDSAGHETGRKFFNIKFEKKKIGDATSKETFVLQPDVYLMKDNNMSSNPDTRSYLTKDIFTYISYTVNKESAVMDTASFLIKELPIGDTSFYSNGLIILNKVESNPNNKRRINPNSMALMADVTVQTKEGKNFTVNPMIEVEGNNVNFIDDTLFAQNLFVRFAGIGKDNSVKIGVKEAEGLIDFVTVKTYIFPYINLVWLGLIVMSMGLMLSMVFRSKMKRNTQIIVLLASLAGLAYMFLFANA